MSTVKANNVQVGQSGTATNNFTLYQPSTPDGTVRLAVGNSGATTGDVLSVSSTGLSVTGTLTSTGVNTFPAGSASAPSITTTGDTNTGVYFPAADTAAITTGGTERMRINADGTIKTGSTISVGGATPSTSGAGITFPATQSASSDANTLDDYEEGTWTPSIGGTATYTARTGTYRKIGSQVTCWFDVTINAVGTGSGALQGLPFANNASAPGGGNVGYFASLVASFVMINPIVPGGLTSISFETATAATATIGDNQNIWQNSSRCTGFVTYHV